MSVAASPSLSACPGCVARPDPVDLSEVDQGSARIVVSLPTIHCAACISKIETALNACPGVNSARVNLTLKRANIDAEPHLSAADLVPVIEDQGFEAHELDPSALQATEKDPKGRALLMRLAVAGFASMNVMLLSVAVWSGAGDATRDLFHWISAAIALPAVAFCAQPFFSNAWVALKHGRLNMDVPVSLAIALAVVTSLWETTLSGEHAYFDAAMALTFFLLAGRYLDHRTRAAARSAAQELCALEVPRAFRLTDDVEEEVPVAELVIGDMVLVRPGGRMPVDGEIVAGHSEIDRSILTGETQPIFAGPGQMVSAGEVNLTGPLTVRAVAVGADTSLHRMADLVAVAESGRERYTPLADQAAKLYAPGVHILSALAFLGWYLYTFDVRTALNIAAAVLIITCPCALGLAVPAVTTAVSGRLFRKGMLIKDSTALERLAEVDTVVFDKTGTLTRGMPNLSNLDMLSKQEAGIAAALAAMSAHPLARAILSATQDAGVVPAEVTGLTEKPGYGMEGRFEGRMVRLGRASWVDAEGVSQTATFLRLGDGTVKPLIFDDRLRDGAAEMIGALHGKGVSVALLSGDTSNAVGALAARLGIEDWKADALPEDKIAYINGLQEAGRKVLMVGDGLNDTGALAAAHVSISPASALDAARVASDIVMLGQDLGPIATACDVSRIATRRIRENFRIATLYNIIAVPLAVAGLATPLIAALAMSTSSITVSLNALRLR